MKYEQYLFACLLKETSISFANMPYDDQYEFALEHYKYFEQSKYNDPNNGLYECMIKYINTQHT